MTHFVRARRIVCWAAGGAILSPYVGAPIWVVLGEPRATHPIFWLAPVAGAIVGLVAMVTVPDDIRRRSATAFGVAYPTMLSWWVVWAKPEPQLVAWLVGVPLAGLSVVAVVRAVPDRAARALRTFAAAATWIFSILLLPVYGFGLVTMPVAISLTIVARRDRGAQRSLSRDSSTAARSEA